MPRNEEERKEECTLTPLHGVSERSESYTDTYERIRKREREKEEEEEAKETEGCCARVEGDEVAERHIIHRIR